MSLPAVEARTGLARLAALSRKLRSRSTSRFHPLVLFAGLLSLPYGLITWSRNALYAAGLLRSHSVGVRVISVGNLTTGGTGKTPVVAMLARAAAGEGCRPAILTRGYRRGGSDELESDEVSLYRRLVPEVPVVVDADRVRGARAAIRAGADLILLDDGFQHRRLRRDVDLVLLDSRDPFGGDHHLPLGMLREWPSGLRRASAALFTRHGRATGEEQAAAARRVAELAPDLPQVREDHRPVSLVKPDGQPGPPLDELAGQQVLVFSGIGDPHTLTESVASLGADVVGAMDFGDHHVFAAADLARIAVDARSVGADRVITTEKDLMRIADWRGPSELLALRIEATLCDAESAEVLGGLLGLPLE